MHLRSENIMSLHELVRPYQEKKDSGLLSVKVDGFEYLLKIYFVYGMVVGLSIGALKNKECFDVLGKCKPVDATFIQGYKPPDFIVADKEEVRKKLEELFASYPLTGGTIIGDGADTVKVTAKDIAKLEADFINIIGPIGKMVVDTVYSEIGYARGKDMPSNLYSHMIDKLRGEIPSQHQSSFTAKYALGLALGLK